MKIYNIHKLIAVLFISTLFLTSCNNDNNDVPITENTFNGNGLKVLTYAYHKKGVAGKGLSVTTIAEFDTQDTYNNYADDLDSQVDALDDAFVAEWGYLDDDALNAKEEELGFDSEKPLTDFENQNDFYSLRNKYYEEENTWLNHDVLDENNDPNDKDIFDFDEAEMALMNPKGEIKIGSKIYKYVETGILKINDGDFEKLIQYNDGDMSVLNDPNVEFETKTDLQCDAWMTTKDYHYYTSTRRVKRKIKIRSVTSTYAKFKAKIISYKKRSSGNGWKRKRIWLDVGVQTYSFCGNVDAPGWSGYKHKKRKKLKKKMTFWNNSNHLRAQKYAGSVVGRFKYGGNSTYLYIW